MKSNKPQLFTKRSHVLSKEEFTQPSMVQQGGYTKIADQIDLMNYAGLNKKLDINSRYDYTGKITGDEQMPIARMNGLDKAELSQLEMLYKQRVKNNLGLLKEQKELLARKKQQAERPITHLDSNRTSDTAQVAPNPSPKE